MEDIVSATAVKKIPQYYRERVYDNVVRNEGISEFYQRMLVEGIIKKRLQPDEVHVMRERMRRFQNCNKFWLMETYQENHIKVFLRTYRCKNRFCSNCNQIKKLVLQKRFLPYMEQYKDSLYHMVLTVPDCNETELKETLQNMLRCFKTLVTYLNGNKKVKGIDLIQYGFQGCIRSLEITYKGDIYHPHLHVAAVFANDSNLGNKYTVNQFSGIGKRHFSDFEVLIQRIWWLLINHQRVTSDNILNESSSVGRYSCVADKFQPDDYEKLFGYMMKLYSEDNRPMTYKNFKTLYYTLNRVRQIQGYGVFYNVKELNEDTYSEHEYEMLKDYLICEEQPVSRYEPVSRIAKESNYTILKMKRK